jgi:hypothetical protein
MKKAKKRPASADEKGKHSPYLVFVSHATADKWIAKVFCEKIEAVGAEFFRDDRDIDGGEDIPEKIRRQIIRSNEMVVLLTPASVDRPWVQNEVGAAWGRRKNARIIAVLCHVGVDAIPGVIGSKKALSINASDEYLDELRQRVERYCS